MRSPTVKDVCVKPSRYPLCDTRRIWEAAICLLIALVFFAQADNLFDKQIPGDQIVSTMSQVLFLWLIAGIFGSAAAFRMARLLSWVEVSASKITVCWLGQRSTALGLDGLVLREIEGGGTFRKIICPVMVFREGNKRVHLPAPDAWQKGSPVREVLIQHLGSSGVQLEAPLYEAELTGDAWPLHGLSSTKPFPHRAASWAVAITAVPLLGLLSFSVFYALIEEPGWIWLPSLLTVSVLAAWIGFHRWSKRRILDDCSVFSLNGLEAKLSRKDAVLWSEDRDQVRALVLVVRKRPILGFQFRFELETLYSRRHALTPWLNCAFNDPGPMLNRARLVGLPVKLDSEEGSTLLPWDG